MSSVADRNLLFGILAVQNDLVSRDALIAAMNAWMLEKDKPLGQILVDLGQLSQEDHDLIEPMVRRHIAKNGGDVARSLRAVSSAERVAQTLNAIDDPDIRQSLTILGVAPPKAPTSDGFVLSDFPEGDEGDRGPGRKRRPEGGWKAGRFRVIAELGGGGMGKVYEAWDDEELGRRVALKMVRNEKISDDNTLKRWEHKLRKEGEINGNLEHPNIIPVYGLGTTDDGKPFYAMRFIDSKVNLHHAIKNFHAGLPILNESYAEKLDLAAPSNQDAPTMVAPHSTTSAPSAVRFDRLSSERNVDFRQLLERFTDICDAIDYAHSRRVLHRDLKPGNVMLGKHGETLVIDWGLAKTRADIQAESRGEKPAETLFVDADAKDRLTLAGQAQGTLGYMAPEQLAGDLTKINERSDIFALGAILYQLLTDQIPFLTDEIRAIHDGFERIKRLSAVIEAGSGNPRSLNPSVPKPLAAICVKALAADPANRYKSAAALAEDVEKWLADAPVTAYQENALEKSRRWARKNRTMVSAGIASIILLAIGGVSFGIIQNRYASEINTQRNLAMSREKMAIDAVKRYADAVANNPELKNRPELEALRKELLKEPIDFFRKLKEELKPNRSSSPESLALLADGAIQLGKLIEEIGDKQDAIRTYQEAIAIAERLVNENPESPAFRSLLARSHGKTGSSFADISDMDSARDHYESARSILEKLIEEQPRNAEFRLEMARVSRILPFSIESREAAKKLLEEALQANPTNSEIRYELAFIYMRDGIRAEEDRGDLQTAGERFTRAIEILEKLVAQDPELPKFSIDLARGYNNFAMLSSTRGRFGLAREYFDKTVEIQEKLVRQDPRNTDYRSELAGTYNNLGMLSSGTGQSNDARKFYEKSIEIQSSAVRDNPSVTIYRRDLAAHYHNYGMLLLANRETNTALENVEKSLAIREDLVRTDPTDNQFVSELARSFYQYGMVKKHASQFADALASFEKGIAIQESLVSRFPQSPSYRIDLVYSYTIVCDVLIRTGHFRKAHEWLSKSLEVAKVHSENYFNFEVTQQIGQSSTRFAATCPDTELSIQFLESGIEWYSLVLRVHPDDIAKLREVAFLWNTLLGLVVKSRNPRERFENLDAKLAGTYSDLKAIKSFKSLLHNAFAWWLASAPVRDKADYMKAVDLAHSALEPNPNAGGILNTLGVAQYRAGMVREASETLRKSLELNNAAAKGVEQPGDLAFLAMALFELDRKDEAQATYARLVEAMKDPKLANDRENRQFYREATNLIHPMTLPDVPAIFQPIHP